MNVFAINGGKVINSVTFQASDDSYYIVVLQATDSLNSNFTDNATLSVSFLFFSTFQSYLTTSLGLCLTEETY